MDTRDRLEEAGKAIDKNGKEYRDEKSLLSYIQKKNYGLVQVAMLVQMLVR